MIVFKFGGASVKSADAVKNIVNILERYPEKIVVVVSAMGKTTNALERIIENFFNKNEKATGEEYSELKDYHYSILEGLFDDRGHEVYDDIGKVFAALTERLAVEPTLNYDFDYDQIIGFGEVLSTKIIAHYLKESGLKARWMDVRKAVKTDNNFREGRIDWELSSKLVKEQFDFQKDQILVTQGFLASTYQQYLCLPRS